MTLGYGFDSDPRADYRRVLDQKEREFRRASRIREARHTGELRSPSTGTPFTRLFARLRARIQPVFAEYRLFGALSFLGNTYVRPIIRHTLGPGSQMDDMEPGGHWHIVGRRGIVTRTVGAGTGQIRMNGGELWTARSFDPAHRFALGDAIEVLSVDGLAALVGAVPAMAPS